MSSSRTCDSFLHIRIRLFFFLYGMFALDSAQTFHGSVVFAGENDDARRLNGQKYY